MSQFTVTYWSGTSNTIVADTMEDALKIAGYAEFFSGKNVNGIHVWTVTPGEYSEVTNSDGEIVAKIEIVYPVVEIDPSFVGPVGEPDVFQEIHNLLNTNPWTPPTIAESTDGDCPCGCGDTVAEIQGSYSMEEFIAACEVCKEPIDYCQGGHNQAIDSGDLSFTIPTEDAGNGFDPNGFVVENLLKGMSNHDAAAFSEAFFGPNEFPINQAVDAAKELHCYSMPFQTFERELIGLPADPYMVSENAD